MDRVSKGVTATTKTPTNWKGFPRDNSNHISINCNKISIDKSILELFLFARKQKPYDVIPPHMLPFGNMRSVQSIKQASSGLKQLPKSWISATPSNGAGLGKTAHGKSCGLFSLHACNLSSVNASENAKGNYSTCMYNCTLYSIQLIPVITNPAITNFGYNERILLVPRKPMAICMYI